MPIYGYRCSQCGHELEVFQSMSDQPLRVCSECGGALRKLMYPVGVHFKGSGFYTTDYKNGGGSKPTTAESSGTSGDSAGGGESSSTKTSNGSGEKKTESAVPSKE